MRRASACKALCLWGVLLLLTLICACALAQAELPQEKAQLLLVYDASNPSVAREDVECMSMMITALGKSLFFGDIGDFADSLGEYEYVICYRLEEIAPREMKAIRDYAGHLLILGSDFMRRYLSETGQENLIVRESSFDRGVLHYAFSPETAFEEIVIAENLTLFETRSEGGGTLETQDQVYPFFGRVGDVQFTPVTSLSANLVQTALMQEITNWMWPYENTPPDYGQYLVLDAIYPFMDAQMLLGKIEALIEEGVPFVLSVMPLYNNVSYPAMVQFCQVLQYAQQCGGFIILHAPIIQTITRDTEELYAVLTDALDAYIDNGVYPLGIEVPVSWTNDDFYLNIMRRFRTVFVYDDDAPSGFALDAGYNRLYYNYHQLVMPVIPLDKTGASHLTCYSSAIYLDAYETQTEQIHELMSLLKNERVPFQDLWELSHTVWGNDLSLHCEGKMLYLNDEPVKLTYEPIPFDEDYDYERDLIDRITLSLQNQNKTLTALTVIIVAIFVTCMIYLRRFNRRSFFYGDD